MVYNLEAEVRKTIANYNLISKDEKVVVALSGGKDSTTVLYLLYKLGYNVEGLMIDLHLGKWSDTNKENVEKFCSELGVKLTIVDLKKEIGHGICFIKSVLKKEKNLTGCTVCGIIKRYILNKWARKLGADKIATGHNLDDETQTVLMNFLKGNVFLGVNSSPATGGSYENIKNKAVNYNKSKIKGGQFSICGGEGSQSIKDSEELISNKISQNFVQRIKPLFFVPEGEIRKFAKKMDFPVLYERCPCAIGTYRVETRAWLEGISDKEKLKIVQEFQKKIPSLRKEQVQEIKACSVCGEPARGEICNACKIFAHLGVKK